MDADDLSEPHNRFTDDAADGSARATTAVLQLLLVSLPVMALRVVGFHLVGSPCLLTDASTFHGRDRRRHACFRRLEEYASLVVLLAALAFLAAAMAVWHFNNAFQDAPIEYW